MAGVAFAVEGDGVGFATESYAASALYATLANLLAALWRIRRVNGYVLDLFEKACESQSGLQLPDTGITATFPAISLRFKEKSPNLNFGGGGFVLAVAQALYLEVLNPEQL